MADGNCEKEADYYKQSDDDYKDEVREVGRSLGLPSTMVDRQPFPGPGLAIRIIGDITEEKLNILKDADYIFREEAQKAGLNKELSQYFAVLTDTKAVGVIGDARTYGYVLALRSVTTEDFMTADWTRLPYELLETVSDSIDVTRCYSHFVAFGYKCSGKVEHVLLAAAPNFVRYQVYYLHVPCLRELMC